MGQMHSRSVRGAGILDLPAARKKLMGFQTAVDALDRQQKVRNIMQAIENCCFSGIFRVVLAAFVALLFVVARNQADKMTLVCTYITTTASEPRESMALPP